MYRTLARWCFRNAWTVVGIWVFALIGINAAGVLAGSGYNGEFESPDSESTAGFETLAEYFPGAASSFGGSIVFQTSEGGEGVEGQDVVDAMNVVFEETAKLEGITVVSPYTEFGAEQISEDGTIAFASLNLANDVDQTEAVELGKKIREYTDVAEAAVPGLRIEIGGASFEEFAPPSSEIIGVAFAIVVLILLFGSVLAMGLPIGVAVAGVGAGGFGLVTLLANVTTIPEFAPFIGLMIGLGVGIDYALFIVTRYRELTRQGLDAEEATVGAMDTAGRAVLFAGITVVMSLLGMLLIGLKFISGLGIAAAVTVAVTLFASMTLLPALLGLTHTRVEITRWRGLIASGFAAIALLGVGLKIPLLAAIGGVLVVGTVIASFFVEQLRREVPPRREKPRRDTIAYRWSRLVQHHPWLSVLVGGGLLLGMTLPAFGLRLGFSDEGNLMPETSARQAYDLIADGFGPGFNGPLIVAFEIDDPSQLPVMQQIVAAVEADPGVDRIGGPIPSDFDNPESSPAYALRVIPTTSPQDEETEQTVKRLRSDVVAPLAQSAGLNANVTGAVAANIDFSEYLSGRIIVFFAAVLAVSFLLLMMVFRSLLVPLKAVIMNVLSISAAYGVVIAIFQWGWLGSFFNVEPAPIEPFVPMMLFAIVFGLSMDYEVFLLSRVKEEYDRTGDPVNSVADGLASTARVITAAAAIMVVVFGAFLLEDDRIVKLFGTGLALAVLLDATLVRMLLVPATMELLGSRNWWLPRWLDRILPTLHVEGHEIPGTHDDTDDRVPVSAGD